MSGEIRLVSVQNPDMGTVAVNEDGSVTFTPTPGEHRGAARFQYTIADSFRTGTGYVYIAVYPPLVAGDVLVRTEQDTPLTISVDTILSNHSEEVTEEVYSGAPDPVA